MIRIARNLSRTSVKMQKLIISDAAATRLAEICTAEEYLRVSVGGGGCSGYSYEFDLSSEKIDSDEDLIFSHSGQRVGWYFLTRRWELFLVFFFSNRP